MKIAKGFLVLGFILVSLILVPQVLAETATPSSRPNPKRQEIRVEKLNAVKRERIMSFSNKMIVRLEATIERLEKLIIRIEERNVSEIKVYLRNEV